MIKISKLADYATQIMHALIQQSHYVSAAILAEKTGIAEPTVSKLLKKLTEAELLHSERGSRGGYRLAKLAEKINLANIITAIDGKPAITECSKQHYDCLQEPICMLRGNWQYINHIIFTVLSNISLQDMANSLPKNQKMSRSFVLRANALHKR